MIGIITLLLQGQPLKPVQEQHVINWEIEQVALPSKELLTDEKGNYYFV